jgi:hypothetical protein
MLQQNLPATVQMNVSTVFRTGRILFYKCAEDLTVRTQTLQKSISTYMIILPPCGQREGNKNTLDPSSSLQAKCGATIIDLHKEQRS